MAVYVSDEHDTVSPALTVSPPVMLISEPLAATAQCTTTVPPPVSSVAVATGDALPVAFVSLVMLENVSTPAEAPGATGFDMASVATAVPGLAAVPVSRNLSLAVVLRVLVTRSATEVRNADGCVTAMIYPQFAELIQSGQS